MLERNLLPFFPSELHIRTQSHRKEEEKTTTKEGEEIPRRELATVKRALFPPIYDICHTVTRRDKTVLCILLWKNEVKLLP